MRFLIVSAALAVVAVGAVDSQPAQAQLLPWRRPQVIVVQPAPVVTTSYYYAPPPPPLVYTPAPAPVYVPAPTLVPARVRYYYPPRPLFRVYVGPY